MFGSEYTPWALFTDFGLIFGLILIGKLIRVKVKFIQSLFIPPSLIAGLLGLILGRNGFDILPFSSYLGTYSAILIALVFGSLPFTSTNPKLSEIKKRVGPLWIYSQLGMLLQWSIAGIFGLTILKLIWPNLNPAFGIMLPTGFYGGHGTASAIGSSFDNLGWDEATSLGMTTATIGIILAIVGGLIIVKFAAKNGQTKFIKDFSDMPTELRTGLVPKEKREDAGMETTSSISLDSLAFHLAIVFFVAFLGYLISQGVKVYYPKLELPVFSCAFIVGLILKQILSRSSAISYICPKQTVRLSSTFTDLLVAFGVASIKLSVVFKYAMPLITLIFFGVILVFIITFYLGVLLNKNHWFEKSIFAWGWWTGTMAMGIALLRIVDPKLQSKALDDYALAYLPIAPVEILLITFIPTLFAQGYGLVTMISILFISFLLLVFARKIGWINSFKPRIHESQ